MFVPGQAQTTPLEPTEPAPLPPATSLLFPKLYVTWEGSGGEQIDKPIQLRGMQSGERVLMTEGSNFPGSENDLAIKTYPRIPQGASFAITTTVQDSAKEVNIENVTIRPILSQDASGQIESVGEKIPLTPITIDEDTKGYSLSNQNLGEYALQVFVIGKESSVLGGYETRLQIIPAGTMQTVETEGDAVPSTEAAEVESSSTETETGSEPATATTTDTETATATTTESEGVDELVNTDFLSYEDPALGIGIQYPVGWEIEEEDDGARFVQQRDIVTFDAYVNEVEDPTLSDYVNSRVNELSEQRQDFKIIESTPTTISGNHPAHKLVYTFVKDGGPRDGETNKVMRIWALEDNKLYTVAYISELDKFSDYLPAAQNMIDSFRKSAGDEVPVNDMRLVAEAPD